VEALSQRNVAGGYSAAVVTVIVNHHFIINLQNRPVV
jgi:hypothetical protein